MDNIQVIQALSTIGASITTSGFLLLAWMLERRRADRLEAILFEDWRQGRVLDRSQIEK